ncbi:MAG: hypothetical protein IKO06_04235 [Alphaproteobacteria bacterium]|nr:hypothetical protein [Alphaproteobacteria bacterium]
MSFMRNTTSTSLLPICDEDAPQLSNDVYNNTLRSECGVDAPAFLSAVYKNSTQAKKRQADAPQYGRSMIEMLGVLAIVGVLSVGGIAGYTKAMLNFKTNSTIETMLTITANIRTFSLRMKDYTGIKAAAIKLKAIPEKALSADRSDLGENAFGGTIAIDAYVGKSFYVAMNGLPKDACISIATNDFGNSLIYAGGVDFETKNIGLNDNDKKNLKNANAKCGANYCLKQQMTPPQAANACACTADTCSVALITF